MTLPVKPISEIEEKAQVWVDDRILILDADSEEARLASKDELKGDKWDTWEQWPQGIQWIQWEKWDKWDKWDTWSQWPKGETWDEWPQGETWPQWVSVSDFEKISWTWAAGTSDTYEFTLSDWTTFDFSVYNGANGEWSGDMIAANNLSDLTNFTTARTNLSVYSKAEIDALLANFWWFVVVATLPTQDIKSNVIYLKWPIGTWADKYEEWIYYSSTWTKIWETSVDLSPFLNLNTQNSDVITEWTDNLFLTAAERTKLGNTSGTNTWDQSASDFDIKDLADTTWLRNTWNNKQNALTTQTAYTSKWTATKVPQITTNNLWQVTWITEVTITQPTVNNSTITFTQWWTSKGDITLNQSSAETIALDAWFTPWWTATTGYVVTKTAGGYEWAAPTWWIQLAPNTELDIKYHWYGSQASYDGLNQYYTDTAWDTAYFTI